MFAHGSVPIPRLRAPCAVCQYPSSSPLHSMEQLAGNAAASLQRCSGLPCPYIHLGSVCSPPLFRNDFSPTAWLTGQVGVFRTPLPFLERGRLRADSESPSLRLRRSFVAGVSIIQPGIRAQISKGGGLKGCMDGCSCTTRSGQPRRTTASSQSIW